MTKEGSETRLDILNQAKAPVIILALLLGVLSGALFIEHYYPDKGPMLAVFYKVLGVLFVLVFAWMLANLSRVFEHYCLRRIDPSVLEPTTVGVLGRITRLFIWGLIILFALQSLGLPISGLLALGGAGTLVIGLASRDLLANFFGALTIYLDRPFHVGEIISSPEKNIDGVVEHIGWRLTRIRRMNKHPIYVPNSLFSSVILENPSRMTHRQIKEYLIFRYEDIDKLPALWEEIQTMLDEHPDLDHQNLRFLVLSQLAPSALVAQLSCFTKVTETLPFLRVQEALFLRILQLARLHGCEVGLPAEASPVMSYSAK